MIKLFTTPPGFIDSPKDQKVQRTAPNIIASSLHHKNECKHYKTAIWDVNQTIKNNMNTYPLCRDIAKLHIAL